MAYVRWTEQRNLEAFLDLLAAGRIDVARLITHRVPIAEAERAYTLLDRQATEPSLGIVLTYPAAAAAAPPARTVTVVGRAAAVPAPGALGIGVIGAAFARAVFFPALRRTAGVRLRAVAASSGASALRSARRFGFERATTELGDLLGDPEVRAVFVLTPHRLHAALATAALKAGRHVFVEKPLCVTEEDLRELAGLYRALAAGPAAPGTAMPLTGLRHSGMLGLGRSACRIR